MTELTCEQCRSLLMDNLDTTTNQTGRTSQQQETDLHLSACDACNHFLQQIWQVQALATSWHDTPVPEWQRRRTFFEDRRFLPTLQWISSFASVLVLVLVLGQARITTADGLAIEFGATDYLTPAELDSSLSLVRAEIEDKQQAQIDLKVNQLTSQQIAANQLLMRTLLEMGREERRAEFTTLLTAWDSVQDQRSQQTNESIRVLLESQVEDKRNIQQINRLLRQASLEGTNL